MITEDSVWSLFIYSSRFLYIQFNVSLYVVQRFFIYSSMWFFPLSAGSKWLLFQQTGRSLIRGRNE